MADGLARVTDRPGVCLVTSGPGATNLITGVAAAHVAHSPVVVLVGGIALDHYQKDAFQEFDLVGMFRPVTKLALQINKAERIPELLRAALRTAMTGRQGPVFVEIPRDVLSAELPAPAVSTYVLPRILTRFRRTHPRVQLAVRTGHSEEILELVLREEVQIGLGRALRHPGVEAIPLYEDELVLVVDPTHRFAEAGAVGTEEISEVQLILFDRTSSYHDLTSAFFREAGVVLRGVMELDNIDAAKKMVEQGLGVALLPHTAVAGELEAGTLRAVRLADAPTLRREIVIFRMRDAGAPSGALDALLNCLSDLRPTLQAAAQSSTA